MLSSAQYLMLDHVQWNSVIYLQCLFKETNIYQQRVSGHATTNHCWSYAWSHLAGCPHYPIGSHVTCGFPRWSRDMCPPCPDNAEMLLQVRCDVRMSRWLRQTPWPVTSRHPGADLYTNQLDWVDWLESIHFSRKIDWIIQFLCKWVDWWLS